MIAPFQMNVLAQSLHQTDPHVVWPGLEHVSELLVVYTVLSRFWARRVSQDR